MRRTREDYLPMMLLPDPFLNGQEDPHWCILSRRLAIIATKAKDGTEVRIKAVKGQLAEMDARKGKSPPFPLEGFLVLKRITESEFVKIASQRKYITRKTVLCIERRLAEALIDIDL